MDPKNLDPKLKEAYDRVMGMDLSNSPATATNPLTTPSQNPNMPPPPPPALGQAPSPLPPPPELPNSMTNPPVQEVRSPGISNSFETQSQQTVRPEMDQAPHTPPPPLNPIEQAAPLPSTPPVPKEVFQSFNAAADTAPTTTSPSSDLKTKPKIALPILIFVGAIFFIIYAVLWGKIFGVF